jgi:hypothetical protein
MSKLHKETELFGGNRRETVLVSYQVLQTKAKEKRIKFSVKMPLSNRSLVGVPEWISDSFEPMSEDDSAQTMCKLDRMLEGMTLEVFSTDTIKRASLVLTGVTVSDLKLQRDGEGKDGEVSLYATFYSSANMQAYQWAWELLRGTFYAAFEYSQTEMNFSQDEEVDQDEPEGEEAEPATNYMGKEHDEAFKSTPAQPPPKPKKGRGFRANA